MKSHAYFSNAMAVMVTASALFGFTIGAPVGRETTVGPIETGWRNLSTSDQEAMTPLNISEVSEGDFPICTDLNGTFAPFCLPQDGADVIVDATYYATWNADFYPLNATITIEVRFARSTTGDSAFTSERTANSYGYLPLHMRKEWLQGKPQNALTLYIIELDPTSDKRASARQGPRVMLQPQPVEHYTPPPPLPFNRLALYIGLPVSLGVVVAVVAGLFFGKQESRRIGLGNVMGSRRSGYGVGKSKKERLRHNRKEMDDTSEDMSALKTFSDEVNSALSEVSELDPYFDLERTASHAFKRDEAKLKSWKV